MEHNRESQRRRWSDDAQYRERHQHQRRTYLCTGSYTDTEDSALDAHGIVTPMSPKPLLGVVREEHTVEPVAPLLRKPASTKIKLTGASGHPNPDASGLQIDSHVRGTWSGRVSGTAFKETQGGVLTEYIIVELLTLDIS